jgi:hypothetical protein
MPPEQVCAQPPQLFASVCSSTHPPLQGLSPVGQLVPHDVPLHVALPPVGTGHAVHELVPQLLIELLLTHVPLHAWEPLGHAHVPLWQVVPPAQAPLHVPQLFGSLAVSTSQPFAALPSQSA